MSIKSEMPREKPAQKTIEIDGIQTQGNLILSPMAGFSDLPFRSICRDLGSAMSYTEFVSTTDIINNAAIVKSKLAYNETERPIVFQLYGEEIEQFIAAVDMVLPLNPDIIDINMGCPAKSIANRGAGVGLMRTPEKIAGIFSALTKRYDVPITGKIRLGWDNGSRNYLQIAKIIQDNGGKLIAVHARTRKQGYNTPADWSAITEVCQNVSIPVIGNGGIASVDDVDRMLRDTGCSGVMVGRKAIGNPWIFSKLDRREVSYSQVKAIMEVHLQRSMDFYGPERGLILFRKHASRYLLPYSLHKNLRKVLFKINSADQFKEMLDSFYLEDPSIIISRNISTVAQ